MNKFKHNFEMVKLADFETTYNEKLTSEQIEFNKNTNRIFSEAHRNAKPSHCLLCKKECSSFCNSHSVPKFALLRIAENGMVSSALQNKEPFNVKCIGINKTGTFHIICNNCDNESFQDYENPQSYSNFPTNKMLAQIALKNYLLMIYKKLEGIETYKILEKQFPYHKDYTDEQILIENLDLAGYLSEFEYAQKAIKKARDKYYHVYYYKTLDYVVPYAAQSAITLIGDFEGNVVNDIYSLSSEYKTKDIHVAVFPLEKTSVVILFAKDNENRYKRFYKQFQKLSPEDKLSAINYIIFSYIENVFINPTLQKELRNNKHFITACGLSGDVTAEINLKNLPFFKLSPEEVLAKATTEFSLSKRHDIPNLLSEEYAIK